MLEHLMLYLHGRRAEPESSPHHPQEFAELMGGRVPITATEAEIPVDLRQVLIGERTAAEIGWVR